MPWPPCDTALKRWSASALLLIWQLTDQLYRRLGVPRIAQCGETGQALSTR
jgi:hypothetical protein